MPEILRDDLPSNCSAEVSITRRAVDREKYLSNLAVVKACSRFTPLKKRDSKSIGAAIRAVVENG